MPAIGATASMLVQAPADVAYGIFRDYHSLHPRVLPRPPFGALVVERGGTGAGTVFTVEARQGLRIRKIRMEVSEPEPGRVLSERDLETGSDMVTSFTVDPVDGGRHSRVTITSRWTRPGIRGWLERLLLVPTMRVLFRKQLRNVDRLARERAAAGANAAV